MGRTPKVGCGLAALLTTFVGCCGWRLLYEEPRRRLHGLLRGDTGVEVLALTITGQQQRVVLSDPESVRYLTAAFRGAVEEGHVPSRSGGCSFAGNVRLGSVTSAPLGLVPAVEEDGVTVAFPIDAFEEPTYYWVSFPQPMPPSVSAALDRMRRR